MPLIESNLEDRLGAVTLYKSDLLWLEQRSIEVIGKPKYNVWFRLNGKQYTINSIEELIEELNSWGVNELDNISYMGIVFRIFIRSDFSKLELSIVEDSSKILYLQILDFLRLKINNKPEDKTRILLYEKPNPNEVSQSKIETSVKYVNTEINLTQTDSINPTATIITGNNYKTTFSLLGKDKTFWITVLGVVVAIATLVITYLLAKGII